MSVWNEIWYTVYEICLYSVSFHLFFGYYGHCNTEMFSLSSTSSRRVQRLAVTRIHAYGVRSKQSRQWVIGIDPSMTH